MKALYHARCGDIRGLRAEEPVICACGAATAWWVDAERGTAKVYSTDEGWTFFIGLSNAYLLEAARALIESAPRGVLDKADSWWRELHEQALTAPGYVFDRSRRACWATIVRIGATGDVSWAGRDEIPSGTAVSG